MVIDYYYEPAYVLDRFPNSKIIKQTDEYMRIELKVNDGWGIKMWLMSQGPSVKVISPTHMVKFMINFLNETLNIYENDTK